MLTSILDTWTGTDANGQDLSGAGSVASTDHINLSLPQIPPGGHTVVPGRDPGRVRNIPVLIQVTEQFVGNTSLQVQFEKDTTTGFSSPTKYVYSETVPVAELVVGYQFTLRTIPFHTDEQFVRIWFEIAGGNPTAGRVWAGITKGNQVGHPV